MSDDPEPRRFEGVTFARQDVKLDGAAFERCIFEPGCRLLFFGEALPTLHECDVGDGVQFILSGHAKLTLQFLSMLYHHSGRGGAETVEGVIHDLRRGAFEPDGAV